MAHCNILTQAEQQEQAALGKPDAEGFITVRRKGRKNTGDGGVPIVSTKSAPALKAKAQNKEANGVVLDFYRFQRRENRRKRTIADFFLNIAANVMTGFGVLVDRAGRFAYPLRGG